jgi:hypothetical protein
MLLCGLLFRQAFSCEGILDGAFVHAVIRPEAHNSEAVEHFAGDAVKLPDKDGLTSPAKIALCN